MIPEITKMKISANLDDNCVIDPPLTVMDLTKKNYITVTNADGSKKKLLYYRRKKKSNKCAISSFTLNEPTMSGVIDEDSKVILITIDELGTSSAIVSLSHATITSDPTVERSYA